MNRTEHAQTQMIDSNAEVCLSALSQKFASRGLAQSVLLEAEEQISAEEKTRELAPCAYRLSLLSDAAVNGIYRRGKETMSESDLVRYAEECRRLQRGNEALEEAPSVYQSAVATSLEPAIPRAGALDTLRKAPAKLKDLPALAATVAKSKLPQWFDTSHSDTSGESRRFPLSAFAAIAAIAVSMMLIVASALMVTRTETKISQLNSDIATLSAEVSDLQADLESTVDLMGIRRIAMEQYGMVEEEYVKMDYITLDSAEAVEAFANEQSKEVGLAAILSAIGWKK